MKDLFGNEIIEVEANEIHPDVGKANMVHGEIIAGKKQVAVGLYELAAGLKTMRDERLYLSLGCESFDDYCERLAKVKPSQAYKYIKVYEELGSTAFQSVGKLGIEKLFLVTQLPPAEKCDAIAEPEIIDGMSVRELKEFVAKARQQGEQLTLLQDEIATLTREKNDAENLIDEMISDRENNEANQSSISKEYESEINDLRNKLEEAERISEEKLKNERDKFAEDAEIRARLKMQLEIDEARKAGENDAEAKASENIRAIEAEKKQIEDKLTELERSLAGRDEQIAGLEKKLRNNDAATTAFKVCLESFITSYDRCIEHTQKISDKNDRTRCENALARAVSRMDDQLSHQ